MSSNEYDITSTLSQGYRAFITERADVNGIFEKHYRIAQELIKEKPNYNDKAVWNKIYESLNVVVVLLNEDRLVYILEDNTLDEHTNSWLCNIITSYPCVESGFIVKVNSRFEHINRFQVDWNKRNKEAIDILFDQDALILKIQEVILGKDKIEIRDGKKSRLELISKNTNEAVIRFIEWCDRGEDDIKTSIIDENANNYIKYICFVIHQLPMLSHSYNNEQITINSIQKGKLEEIVNYVLTNHSEFRQIGGIIEVIVKYNLSISDDLLLTLFPYANNHVRYIRIDDITNNHNDASIFLDYLADNITDTSRLDNELETWIKSDTKYSDTFCYEVLKHIVSYRKGHFYKHFKQLIHKNESSSLRLDMLTCITKLGIEGLTIINDMLDDLSDDDNINYYNEILFPEEESLLSNQERKDICCKLENLFPVYEDKYTRELLLRILLKLGSEKALDWGLEYINENEKWSNKDHFPPLYKYNSSNIDKLSGYFDIATSLPVPRFRMNSILDSTKYALQCIANESEEMRDKVVDMFKAKANIEGLYYLHIVADETSDKYFESNSGIITLKDASLLFQSKFTK